MPASLCKKTRKTRKARKTRKTLKGGNADKLVTFKFSVKFYSNNESPLSAKAENYPKMITSWYTDRNAELDEYEFDSLRDIKFSYDPISKLFEGVGTLLDGHSVSDKDMKADIQSRIDPDNGNYAIVIEKNELDVPNYLLVSDYEDEDEEEENSDYDKHYGIAGEFVSYSLSKNEPMSAEAIAALPAFIPSLTNYSTGVNALAMEDMKEGNVIAFIKSSTGQINDAQGIVVYKANGEPTEAYTQIFEAKDPKNPFTREPIRKEDIVLKRVVFNQNGGRRMRKRTRRASRKTRRNPRKGTK